MLHLYTGTDRSKARAALNGALLLLQKKGTEVMRVTDANRLEDLAAALHSGGMFAQERVVVFEGVLVDDEMRSVLLGELSALKLSTDHFFILEEKLDAVTKKLVEKYAATSDKFDAPKKAASATTIFALADALRTSNKKNLWVGYQRELLNDAAPEAIHGVLFWAAKDMLLKSRATIEVARAQNLIATLTELPHEARRHGEDLEYALERFVLSIS
jgi:hypothetical protein